MMKSFIKKIIINTILSKIFWFLCVLVLVISQSRFNLQLSIINLIISSFIIFQLNLLFNRPLFSNVLLTFFLIFTHKFNAYSVSEIYDKILILNNYEIAVISMATCFAILSIFKSSSYVELSKFNDTKAYIFIRITLILSGILIFYITYLSLMDKNSVLNKKIIEYPYNKKSCSILKFVQRIKNY